MAERNTQQLKGNTEKMYQYVYGNWHTMIAYAYAELGIADLLQESPRTVEEIAALTDTDVVALERVLLCAAALGFHSQDTRTGKLRLSQLGALLSTDSSPSLRAAARLNGSAFRYEPWGCLLKYVRAGTGRGLSPTWECGTLEYLKNKPEHLAVFEEAMTSLGKLAYGGVDEDQVIAETVDFSRFRRVIDVGSGNGTLMEAILIAHRSLKGSLFDLQSVLDNVKLPPADHPNAGRVRKVAGDFYKSIPSGYDAYLMKNVIHNHPEHRIIRILKNIRDALLGREPGKISLSDKRLILFEMVMPKEGDGNVICKLTDLNLNLLVGGTERTATDYRKLLSRVGLELLEVCNLPKLERKVIMAGVRQPKSYSAGRLK
jgi:hypothetical protein